MSNKNPAALELRGISKHYGAFNAVKPLDLTISAGTLVTLLGPSGCGKTTLLRMIAGLERPSGGEIFIGGKDVTNLSARERNVSMVFQSYALFPHMSVADNVAYGLVSTSVQKGVARQRAQEALETVGLSNLGTRMPSEMSGGQQQRVAVARALVLNPDVLLFDEPLSNLDTSLRRTMREEIRALQQRLGITVVYVTHDQAEALAVSDRIVVMRNAGIAQVGTPQELYEQPDSTFVGSFMGEANRLSARIVSRNGDLASARIAQFELNLPHRGAKEDEVDIIVRPHAVSLSDDQQGAIKGIISTAAYMGATNEYVVDTEAGTIFAVVSDDQVLRRVGDPVGVRFAARGSVIIPGNSHA
ncbi:ABC transporter ATP-binding protein [Shinella sp. S4-D37]|uniref:ABC transporter ATP-binding protein n=1 Tax=Shinella sp. S4-D37 TaxID=3161999 RepID=UPI003466DC22